MPLPGWKEVSFSIRTYWFIDLFLGQLWLLSSTKDAVDVNDLTKRVQPGSGSGYLVNKRFPRAIFPDEQLSAAQWDLPPNNQQGVATRKSFNANVNSNTGPTPEKNLAVSAPADSKS